jgi:hypothetical protein
MEKLIPVETLVANRVLEAGTVAERRAVAEQFAAYAVAALVVLDGRESAVQTAHRIAKAAAQ